MTFWSQVGGLNYPAYPHWAVSGLLLVLHFDTCSFHPLEPTDSDLLPVSCGRWWRFTGSLLIPPPRFTNPPPSLWSCERNHTCENGSDGAGCLNRRIKTAWWRRRGVKRSHPAANGETSAWNHQNLFVSSEGETNIFCKHGGLFLKSWKVGKFHRPQFFSTRFCCISRCLSAVWPFGLFLLVLFLTNKVKHLEGIYIFKARQDFYTISVFIHIFSQAVCLFTQTLCPNLKP